MAEDSKDQSYRVPTQELLNLQILKRSYLSTLQNQKIPT